MNIKHCFAIFIALVLAFAQVAGAESAAYDPERLMISGPAIHASANYWTPERMAKAKPYPLKSPRLIKKRSSSRPSGLPGSGNSALPGQTLASIMEETLPFAYIPSSTQGYNYPPPFARYQNFDSYSTYPYATVSKIFFTDGGTDYVCSGAVWPSHSVLTAGHCVYNDEANRYHTNVVVVPQYNNGTSPFGSFQATSLVTTEGWKDSDYAYDLGLVQTANKNGNKISFYTGFLGGKWNVTPVQHFTIIGYPAGRPFNGQTQQICQASYADGDATTSPEANGAGCDLTGGASGGPWITKFSGKAGGSNQVNGVTSYGYSGQPKELYAPYFGGAAKNMWDYARRH